MFEENIDPLKIFFQLLTQFNFAGMGQVTGLNYQSVEFVMRLNNVKNKLDCFNKIRVMEIKAVEMMRGKSDGSTT